MNVKQGVFPGNGRLDGHFGDLSVSMLNAGVAAVERAYCITRARNGAEAREIALDLVSILSGCVGFIADTDFDQWPVMEGDGDQGGTSRG
jgi:hypothetical protein